jgi:hypothetical protein
MRINLRRTSCPVTMFESRRVLRRGLACSEAPPPPNPPRRGRPPWRPWSMLPLDEPPENFPYRPLLGIPRGCHPPRVAKVPRLPLACVELLEGLMSRLVAAAEHPLTQLALSRLRSVLGRLAVLSRLVGFVYRVSLFRRSCSIQSLIIRYAAWVGWTGSAPQRAAVLAASSSEGSSRR